MPIPRSQKAFPNQGFSSKQILWTVALFLTLLSIPFVFNQVQKQQLFRSKASEASQIVSFELELAAFSGDVFESSDITASGGKLIQFGPTEAFFDITTCPTLPTNTGKVVSEISIPSNGKYYFWSRIMTPFANKNSYYLQVDNQCGIVVGGSLLPKNSWKWINYQNSGVEDRIELSLTQGPHTISLIGRQANVKVDRIILTTNEKCTPILKGDNCARIISR